MDKLKQAVFDEIKAIQASGVAAEMIEKIKETRRRAQETDLKDNGFWLRELERAYTYGDDPREIPKAQPMIDKVSSERTQRAAKKYLKDGQFILAVLKPEASATR